jgi:hypothetical protein
MWLKLGKLGDLPADIAPHVLRHSVATRRRYRAQRADYCILARAQDPLHHQPIRPFHRRRATGSSRCGGRCHHEADGAGSSATPVAACRARRRVCRAGERRTGWRVIEACGGVAGGDHAWLGCGAARQARCDTHATPICTVFVRSASSSTMKGSDPPSSSTPLLPTAPASSATARPARTLPSA